ncbi:FAD-binding oxidoreductase [Mesorhizobium sp. M2D.F.Ca.ET.185.01.1.1]|uniref:NAD(P)/FAD-dependent oxidoreductase n=3 Tax=Mesorhizobium TaxID=68287 RepID=UPI000FCB8075|nr:MULTISPECIES: FAD-binding oxidoreductase [unclassified Mesorhizobium]TGP73899.1 FAD-binding oxidoreductase [bacterium M00.F.Ca.ET.227.01.1.1]TGP85850.1 FAD-binding oxidoreductase [bacterium M00.F.Ca.ET.221.01.1.1]TGP91077.1 FAD-binding oxidoreductase [bacterium M00.F.Ca.ET.222.01.1.1]TGT68806.1 FAD-binding oxidoreductase [bacterium M00.F.Ca.ET.159.01.1.1]TGT80655.1 FAD-binding oxidoreductase [bacterium M00.F.Ca.ET.157.01.1.1]TGU03042.1 FAD-binding oxidoreductase [bacterium M00.F.Ca.ET.163.
MDVIVLGGGLMGTASAYFLARRGARVTLIERNRIGAGATVASFGNIRRTGRHLSQLPLAHRSLKLWGEAEKMLGRDVEFRATGHIRLIFDGGSLADMRAYAQAARPLGLELEELGPREIRSRFPGLGPAAIAASFSPHDGSGNPRLIAPAFAEAARKLGAAIVENAEVETIKQTGSGFLVATSKGSFAAECLLNTAGAWGAGVAAQFGETVPLDARGPQMGVTEPLPHRILPVVGIWTRDKDYGAYLRQVERGNIVFGGAAERVTVGLDPGHAKADPMRLPVQLRAVARLLPAIAKVAVIRTWSGCEGYVRDMLPVMGRSATTPGLFHAFGFCGHGFQLGPGVGDAMAELMITDKCETPLDDFRVDRFSRAA